MAQIVMVSQAHRDSQRGVGTACQSRGGSHSQGCHWRKRLESCIEIERQGRGREGEEVRMDGRMKKKKRGKRGSDTSRETDRTGGPRGDGGPSTGQREGGDRAVRKNVEEHSILVSGARASRREHQACRLETEGTDGTRIYAIICSR